jgi:hypothetical protein
MSLNYLVTYFYLGCNFRGWLRFSGAISLIRNHTIWED